MKRFAFDYEGFFYLNLDDSYSETDAFNEALKIMSQKHPMDEFDGEWDIVNVELVSEDENR